MNNCQSRKTKHCYNTSWKRKIAQEVSFKIPIEGLIFSKIWLNGQKYLPSDYYCISKRVRFRNVSIDLTALCLVSIEIREYWENRGALYGTQRKVPTNFIPYISKLVLVRLSWNRLDPKSGPTFVKIGFNYMYVMFNAF